MLALGFAGGFMAGILGVGGGLIFVPVFREVVKTHSIEADKVPYILANSLLIVFFVGLSGSIRQYKNKNTDIRSAFITGMAAISTSLLLTWLMRVYQFNNQQVFNGIFSALLIYTAIRMWNSRKNTSAEDHAKTVIPPTGQFIPAGLFAGIITATTGLGGGIILVPYFNKILKLPIKFATGLSLTVIPVLALPLLAFYMVNEPEKKLFENMQTGYILWPVVVPMIIASIMGTPLGVMAARKMKSLTVLIIFIAFIVVNLVKILFL